MYLQELNLWNFRQFGKPSDDLTRKPDFSVRFNDGLNLLVGENDCGKSTVVDAINYIVIPHSHEYLRIGLTDFHHNQQRLRIECIFSGFSIHEAKNFIEYLSIDEVKVISGQNIKPEEHEAWIKKNVANMYLRLTMEAEIRSDYTVSKWNKIRAGGEEDGIVFDGAIRELLSSMYLKPLRNAEYELKARPGSRLSQILSSHKNFQEASSKRHPLTEFLITANTSIREYFEGKYDDKQGHEVSELIHTHLENLFSKRKSKKAKFEVSDPSITQVLQKLNLELMEKKAGLGALNVLFIAVELLLLKRDSHSGLHLGIVEEAEAHLHTQAQLRILKYLQDLTNNDGEHNHLQLIITTHSTQIASEVNINNLILFNKGKAFSLDQSQTLLEKSDYAFLQRFLDATKANLFFAEGVILVEGDAENLLIPTIARLINRDLIDYGVSIVNVGHSGLFRYANIFRRRNEENGTLNIPVACIKDNDVRYEYIDDTLKCPTDEDIDKSRVGKGAKSQNVESFVSPNWTLEFDIALDIDLRKDFYRAVLYAKKAKNAADHIYLTDEKKKEADLELETAFSTWEGLSLPEIAYKIYSQCKDNKAITAQFFAELLSNKMMQGTATDGEQTPSLTEFITKLRVGNLKYIIDAIEYVTQVHKEMLDD